MAEPTPDRCPACGQAAGATAVLTKAHDGRGEDALTLVRCMGCSTVFLRTGAMSFDPGLYRYYEKFLGLEHARIYDPVTRSRYVRLLESLAASAPGNSVLDVGCGKGDFVDAARGAGWQARGIDLSAQAIAVGKQFSLPVSNTDFFSPEIAPASYDVVTMFEVIEHVADPGRFLRRAQEVVRPGGLVYLSTPNFGSLDRRVLKADWDAIHREHLTYFTPATLRSLVSRAGTLEVRSLQTRNLSPGLIARMRGLPRAAAAPAGPAPDIRSAIEGSTTLRILRDAVNRLLRWTGLGESMVALLQRPKA